MLTERVLWRIAWPCFAAAALLALGNVVLFKAVGITPWGVGIHIAALWLLMPAAWYGLMRFTKGFKADT